MRNGSVFFKSLFGLSAFAFIASFLSSCQKTATSTVDVGDWAIENQFPGIPRTLAVSFTIHYPATNTDTVYIGGGYNGFSNTYLTDFYKFDETNGHAWIQVASFPGDPRDGSAGFSINGLGYIVGGYDGNYHLNDVWSYNPATNTWASVGVAPTVLARTGAVAFNINNTAYYGAGADSNHFCYNDMYQFDGTNWSFAPPLNAKREYGSVFVYGNIAYVVGGVNTGDGNSYPDDLSYYNPLGLPQWIQRRPIITLSDSSYSADYAFNINRSNAPIFLINDTAYMATGNYNGILNTTWCYDIGNDQWFQKSSFEGTARQNAIGFTVNNHGYIATGDNGSNYYDDVWQFFPDAALTADDNVQ
jgi:hypothetical protein